MLPLDRKHLLTHLVKQPYKKHSRGQHCTYSINTLVYPAFRAVVYLDGNLAGIQLGCYTTLSGFVSKLGLRALFLLCLL